MTTAPLITVQNIDAWELPRHHAFKVLGETQYPLAQVVADIARRHCPTFDAATISMRASSALLLPAYAPAAKVAKA